MMQRIRIHRENSMIAITSMQRDFGVDPPPLRREP